MKKLFLGLFLVLIVLVSIVLFRSSRFSSRQIQVKPAPEIVVDASAVERLSKAVQIPTVSFQDPAARQKEQFAAFHTYLEEAFPEVHNTLVKETISEHSLLFTWKGESQMKPIILMGHLDTVPVEPGTEGKWKHAPFSGEIADGYVWGRGTLDDKVGVLAVLEAVRLLLRNPQPNQRTVFLAFGGDEEIGGVEGAARIAELLRSRNVSADFVLDEGLTIAHDLLPNVDEPVAMIGVAEKGYLTIELFVEEEGGHSSMPPKETTIGILSHAVSRLEENPMPAALRSPVREMMEFTGPEMKGTDRVVLANLWLLEGLFKFVAVQDPASAAMLRTTTAPTIFQSGTKENVLPGKATATINFRILQGDSKQTVLDHVQKTIGDERVKMRVLNPFKEPSKISDISSPNFRRLQSTIREIFPEVVVTPALVMGGTDASHFEALSPDIYRFSPLRIGPEDLARVHGTDERVAIKNYEECVRFYYQILWNAAYSSGDD